MSEDEILRQAKSQYQSAYENQVLGANQAHELAELGYSRQMEQLGQSYARQTEQAKGQTTLALSETDRHALSRGMQRSSYNMATLSNVRLAGDKALGDIAQAQTRDEGDIAQQRSLGTKQLGEDLAQALRDYDTNVMTYADMLRDREYQRATEAARYQNELAMAMYEYSNQLQQQQMAQQQWLAEFNESVRQYEQNRADKQVASSSSSGSKSSGSNTSSLTGSSGLSLSAASAASTTQKSNTKTVTGSVASYK